MTKTYNIMKRSIFFILASITINSYAQSEIVWETNLGGFEWESAQSIQQTTDGGYIVAGWSNSNSHDVGGNNGLYDFWIVKLAADGGLVWETNLGGSSDDEAHSIIQTTDGGYLVAGFTESNDGDVSTNHGFVNFWIVKLSADGDMVWETNLGGSFAEKAYSIDQTTDGGYIVAGASRSSNFDVGGSNNGLDDFWIVKLDASASIVWETNLGGSGSDWAESIQQTSDGGYIVAGYSTSNDGDVGGNNGSLDFWIVKLGASGSLVWETNLGGSEFDYARSIEQTTDGGYIVAGMSRSADGDVGGNNGLLDCWIVKLAADGGLVWETNLGGSEGDIAYSIKETIDGGYIVAGLSFSDDGDVGDNNGHDDFWLVKLGATGSLVWETNLGGSNYDGAHSMQLTTDGGLIVAGFSRSHNGDVGDNNGNADYWIVKLAAGLSVGDYFIDNNIILSPNPTANTFTIANLIEEITKIEIIDLQGRVVSENSKIINNTFNIGNLPPAMYVVKIYASSNTYTQRVIKE